MIHLGLIGYPLSHSLSPRLHKAALSACGLEGDYSLFAIEADNRQGLKDILARVRAGEIQGLNVTIPHKQNVIPFLDGLTPTAESIGAVNTIYCRENKLIADNTDAAGFLTDLKRLLITGTRAQRELRALILGAGGSARAVIYALLNDGWDVTVAARRIVQAEQLVTSFQPYQLPITDYDLSNVDLSDFSLVVNTTPLGMTPGIDQSPWPEKLPFPPHAAIYDLVYNPRETKLVREACLQGRRAATGLGMLIAQASLAFEIWTGQRPSREVLFDAVDQTGY
jgi:shikimate dehydrogenase